jgi:hypothetical protein
MWLIYIEDLPTHVNAHEAPLNIARFLSGEKGA